MSEILILGDEICKGYSDTIKGIFNGRAEVWYPETSCGSSYDIIAGLHEWINRPMVDVVHINSGLLDLRSILFGEEEKVVPLREYRENLTRIFKLLRKHSPARVIWATTTPVDDALAYSSHGIQKDFKVSNEDVVLYNEAAKEVASRHGVIINDLYGAVKTSPKKLCYRNDGIHFSREGYEMLAERVATVIDAHLN